MLELPYQSADSSPDGYVFGDLSFLCVSSHTRFPTCHGSALGRPSLPQKIEMGSDFLKLEKFYQAEVAAMSINLNVHCLLWPGVSLLNCQLPAGFEDLLLKLYPACLLVSMRRACLSNVAHRYLNTGI